MRTLRAFEFVVVALGVVISLVFLVELMVATVQAPRLFRGEQTFASIDEAMDFQKEVAREATNIGANIELLGLSKQLPPTVEFRIVVPAQAHSVFGDTPVPFRYGEQKMAQATVKIFNIVVATIAALVLIGAILWAGSACRRRD